ncbi:MAG: hypothetical protein C4518_14410 [Desulfobacteraceae bacterium]|nr:MAG: hypothetical protein C4518_14410 [Desulfobacteraceae bacterium]
MMIDIQVISLKNCGAAVKTIALIKKVAGKMGLEVDPEFIEVKTINDAYKYRHIGGPTIHINGLDIEPEVRGQNQFAIS